jgi:Protein of unknown function with PCYCGC motif
MKRLLSVLCITLAAIISSPAQWLGRATDIPAYHDTRFKKSDVVPPILSPDQLDYPQGKMRPVQVHAYELAAQIPQVIYQQPCYCYCDRGHGHKSLHSCFEVEHGGNCAACLKELYYSYLMTQQKKTPEQIRTGIISGEWQQVNLETAASIGTTPDPPVHKATSVRKKATT